MLYINFELIHSYTHTQTKYCFIELLKTFVTHLIKNNIHSIHSLNSSHFFSLFYTHSFPNMVCQLIQVIMINKQTTTRNTNTTKTTNKHKLHLRQAAKTLGDKRQHHDK